MEVETSTVWLSGGESDAEEVWVEEIVLEEDGSPAVQWQLPESWPTEADGGEADGGHGRDGGDGSSSACSSPLYILPDDTAVDDSPADFYFSLSDDEGGSAPLFDTMELMDDFCGETPAEKAQALLNQLDEIIKQEPFTDWLEEKTELPLLEELGALVGGNVGGGGAAGLVAGMYQTPRGGLLYQQMQPRQAPAPQQQSPLFAQMAPPIHGVALVAPTEAASIVAHVPLHHQAAAMVVSEESGAAPLTPALIREFESVLNQTLTPPRTPPTYLDLVNNTQEEEEQVKRNDLEADLDALINSQVASLYDDDKSEEKPNEWCPSGSATAMGGSSPAAGSDWGSVATPPATEDSDSACHSSGSESDPEWSPSGGSCSSERGSSSPYGRGRRAPTTVEERKMRKKEQNKNAATRYRQKKKAEHAGIADEESVLVDHNVSLKEKTTELQREIKYLKSLMRDICKAKGLIS